jgi:hypothetical protein
MRQHLGDAEVVEIVYIPEGIIIKKAVPQPTSIEAVTAQVMSKYPTTLKRLAE